MKIKNIKKVEIYPVKMEGAKEALVQKPITSKDGSENFAMRVFTLKPGGHTPYHTHNFEHLNYVISGSGGIKKEDGTINPINEGDFVLILPNEKHQYINMGETDFKMICAVPTIYE